MLIMNYVACQSAVLKPGQRMVTFYYDFGTVCIWTKFLFNTVYPSVPLWYFVKVILSEILCCVQLTFKNMACSMMNMSSMS